MTGRPTLLRLSLPPEFVQMCEADGTTPLDVLTGFMRDLCHLEGSNGSDERNCAENYYYRCGYPYREGRRA